MRRIAPRPLEAAAFAPYGVVIDAGGRTAEAINDGTTQRFSDLASLDLRTPDRDPVLGIYVAQARRFPLRIARLERHRQAAQVFVPLGSHRFVVVVAPGIDAPQWDAIAAFITAPGQGVSLRRGCWHHGLVALGDGDRFAVLEGGNYRDDTEELAAPAAIELVTS
jgi:ureidoglycolate lyase